MKPPVVLFWLFIYAFAVSAWRCCSSCSVSAVVTNVLLGMAWTDQYLFALEAPMSSRTVFLGRLIGLYGIIVALSISQTSRFRLAMAKLEIGNNSPPFWESNGLSGLGRRPV
jgi:hypothetical protein